LKSSLGFEQSVRLEVDVWAEPATAKPTTDANTQIKTHNTPSTLLRLGPRDANDGSARFGCNQALLVASRAMITSRFYQGKRSA